MQKNYVVIGYGNWSKKIIQINQKTNNHFKLEGIFFNSQPKDNFYKSNKKIFYSSWRRMILKLKPKIIIVSLPPFLNAKVLEFLKNKDFVKKILIEKPICVSKKDNDFLKTLNKKFKKKVFVHYLDIHSKSIKYLLSKKIYFDKVHMQISGPSSLRKDMSPFWEYSPHFLIFLILKIKNISKYKIYFEKEKIKKERLKFKLNLTYKNKIINLISGNHTEKRFRRIILFDKKGRYEYNDRSLNQLTFSNNFNKSIILKKENLLDNTLFYFFNKFLENDREKRYDYIEISIKLNNLMHSIEKIDHR